MLKITVEIGIPHDKVVSFYEVKKILSISGSIENILKPFIEKEGWKMNIFASHDEIPDA